jgi:hypothetical protein
MESASYDPQTKQVCFHFGNVTVAVDVEDYMDFLYIVTAMKTVVEQDPEVSLGTYVDENGIELQEFVFKDENEEYS